jgi:tetratricopeptide (TPR) repeat protein
MKKTFYFLILLLSYCPLSACAQLYEQSVKQIVSALAADSLQKAEGMIEQTIRLDPTRKSNAVLYQYLGEIYQRRGENEKALEAYSKGIDLTPTTNLFLSRSSLYLQLDNQDRALSDYNQILKAEPDNEDALFFRAFIHSSQRHYKEARADYKRLLELNPMHEDGRLGLAILSSKDGRPREAMEQLDALVQFYPYHAKHYLARCGLYEKRKEYEKAQKDINMAMELEPENPECYLTRASLYLAMKKKKLAAQDCKTAIRLGANPEQVASILGAIK